MADTTYSDRARSPMVPGEVDPDTQTEGERGDARAGGQRSGSQRGTMGGGGADAHNADPARATGVDNPAAPPAKTVKKRTTKKYER